MDYWYYKREDEEHGPLSSAQMRALIDEKQIGAKTLVWSEATGGRWLSLSRTILAETLEEEEHPGDQARSAFIRASTRINQYVGEEGSADFHLKSLFSDVFKRHTREEAELVFISGTSLTTPNEQEIPLSWPKPWLFSRVLLVLVITYLILYGCTLFFGSVLTIPGMIAIGSFAAPFALVVFFYELNAPRNISMLRVLQMFFVGGVASIFVTLILYSFIPIGEIGFFSAIVIGVVEEVGKLIIIAYLIKKTQVKYILNGLLIGAVVGAGFAAFESAGYALSFGLQYGTGVMIDVIFERGWLSIGGHVVWGAIIGAALLLVKRGGPLQKKHLTDRQFLKIFIIPVLLHAVWDMPIALFPDTRIVQLILIAVAWYLILTMIQAGLRQIAALHTSGKKPEQAGEDEQEVQTLSRGQTMSRMGRKDKKE
ncbi:Membrane proteinase PrsW, cleaves anti-sigma factor RsiW, M82 family [Marinococcus luteus]|uniref:Membrane proteinase PrsW, cleaves anti-sigma factor RsiW, M82 family n=1 Tax=Marinococcus luteus TaxID=1122204 RepID=A0A1H2TBI6_9BACI|nr:PrsW family glutamic-type intramembrane protease [Marinococcus luteus]SDW40624.1 Membrane proteinase PrsW, cleaves anti-sigma factor RsiW, M82 family [Marinococcus luteus]